MEGSQVLNTFSNTCQSPFITERTGTDWARSFGQTTVSSYSNKTLNAIVSFPLFLGGGIVGGYLLVEESNHWFLFTVIIAIFPVSDT